MTVTRPTLEAAPARRRAGTWLVGGQAVVVGTAVVASVWLAVVDATVPDRPLPPASAPVDVVARHYLGAALRQDCATTRALTMPTSWAWCSDPAVLDVRDVGAPALLPAAQAGLDEQCVSFTLTTTSSSDGSLDAGSRPWSLCFAQTPEGWRVRDQGFL